MAFNLEDYEDVATLNKWFVCNYPMGSLQIIDKDHKLILNKEGQVIDEIFIATTGVFRDVNDVHPAVMNLARGRQSEYPKHMQRFFAEDVTTSSYGRCLTLLKASDKTATKDDMRKVENAPVRNLYGKSGNSQVIEMALRKTFSDDDKPTDPKAWSVGDVVETVISNKPKQQECSHGLMVLKEGTAKTGRPFFGYVCPAPKGEQCEPRWHKLTANGIWFWEGGE